MIDLGSIPFVEARWYYSGRNKNIRLLVVHTPEFPELNDGAERLANFFATTDRTASVHVTVDNNSMVRSVQDWDTAFGAESANADGLHAELVGYAGQSWEEWNDDYSDQVLGQAAELYASWCIAYNIEPRFLSPFEIGDGQSGITSHHNVWQCYGGDVRTDPGENFPYSEFMTKVKRLVSGENSSTGNNDKLRSDVTVGWINFQGIKSYIIGGSGIIIHEFTGPGNEHYGVQQSALDYVQATGCGLFELSGDEWTRSLNITEMYNV